MEPLIDILSQLSEGEKNDFTSWFSELGKKDREAVANVFARTTLERIRTVLSIPPKDRIALFLVQKNAFDHAVDSVRDTLKRLDDWCAPDGEFRQKLRKRTEERRRQLRELKGER